HIVTHGEASSTISAYLKSSASVSENSLNYRRTYSSGEACITDVRLLDPHGIQCDNFRMGETIIVEFDIEFFRFFESIDFSLHIKRIDIGMRVLHIINQDCGFLFKNIPQGKRKFRIEIPNCLLYPASYQISIWAGTHGGNIGVDFLDDIVSFSVIQS